MGIVQKEAQRVLVGIIVLDIIFIVAGIVFGFFTKNSAYSLAYSSVFCYLSFVITGYAFDRIIKKPAIIAQKQMVIFFIIKILVMFIIMAIAVLIGIADIFALFVPLLAPKFTYFIISIFGKV